MLLTFQKYQGTGNDFVMIDQRTQKYIDHNDQKRIAFLCDRRFGIGADGLIFLELSENYDFKMVYFNADGRQSTMCGNGGRCIVHFAWSLGVCGQETSFEAIDGLHKGKILDKDSVSIQMSDVQNITIEPDQTYVLNTGS
ncbi:MAG TPA: diaminopimelate epimerase, partial [Saprospiraceae bacterium]|nr:diaminopimelate epimerase [Saprospiraceae bacterium]